MSKAVHLYGFGPDYDPYDVWSDQEIDVGDFDTYEEAIAVGEAMVKSGELSEYDTYVI